MTETRLSHEIGACGRPWLSPHPFAEEACDTKLPPRFVNMVGSRKNNPHRIYLSTRQVNQVFNRKFHDDKGEEKVFDEGQQ